MSVLSVFAQGGLLSLLVFAALGAGAGALTLGGRRGALIGAGLGALLITVALLPSPIFREQLGESLIAVFWLSLFLFPIVLYALIVRAARKKAQGRNAVAPTAGLRLIEQDEALFADQIVKLMAQNDAAPGFRRDQFSLAWRDEAGTVVGALRVIITMDLAEIRALHVDEDQRGKGIGAALLRGAEDEARRRGCRFASLYTFSWQVPEFYRRLGWQEVRVIGIGNDAQRFLFEKPL